MGILGTSPLCMGVILHDAVIYFIDNLAAASRTPQSHVSDFYYGICDMLDFRSKFRNGVQNIPPGQGTQCTRVITQHAVTYLRENSATARRTHQNHGSKLRYSSADM